MSHRNMVFAIALAAPLFGFSQGAHAFNLGGFGGWGSEQVRGPCTLSGSWDVPGDDGRTLDLSLSGICNFTIPSGHPDLPCTVNLSYTFPTAPMFTPVTGGYEQDWTAACNDPGLEVSGLLTCDDGKDFKFKDALGLAGHLTGSGPTAVTSQICEKTFGSATATVISAQITYASPDNSSAVVDLSPTAAWNCCHADIQDPLSGTGGTAVCKDGSDYQKCFGSGANTTLAYCTYNDPWNSSCGGPNSGLVTAYLHADNSGSSDPGTSPVDLTSVNTSMIMLNNVPPAQDCEITSIAGEQVIECKWKRCDSSGDFIAPGGIAHLTAARNVTNTTIECIDEVELR
jgi:hypothetical protein